MEWPWESVAKGNQGMWLDIQEKTHFAPGICGFLNSMLGVVLARMACSVVDVNTTNQHEMIPTMNFHLDKKGVDEFPQESASCIQCRVSFQLHIFGVSSGGAWLISREINRSVLF